MLPPKTAPCTRMELIPEKLRPNTFLTLISSGLFWDTPKEELILVRLMILSRRKSRTALIWAWKSSSALEKLWPKDNKKKPLKSSKDNLTQSRIKSTTGTMSYWHTSQSGPLELAKLRPQNKWMKSTTGFVHISKESANKPLTAESFTAEVWLKRTATSWSKWRTWTDFWSEAHPWNQALSTLWTAANWNTSNETNPAMIFCSINVIYEFSKKIELDQANHFAWSERIL